MDVLDIKYTSATYIGYVSLPGIYEIGDLKLILKSSIPNKVKVNITIDDTRLRSNSATKKQ